MAGTAVILITPMQASAEADLTWNTMSQWVDTVNGTIPVLIVRDHTITHQQVEFVENTIISKGFDAGKMHYLGWNQGIQEINDFYNVDIPTLKLDQTPENSHFITLFLSMKEKPQKFDGYTELILDEQNKIEKAFITIYDVDSLSPYQLKSITRHELGHALGLGHTEIENDLMNPVIKTGFDAISILDLHTLLMAYSK